MNIRNKQEYLKKTNSVQMICIRNIWNHKIICKLLGLHKNTWNQTTVRKLFELDWNTLYNCAPNYTKYKYKCPMNVIPQDLDKK